MASNNIKPRYPAKQNVEIDGAYIIFSCLGNHSQDTVDYINGSLRALGLLKHFKVGQYAYRARLKNGKVQISKWRPGGTHNWYSLESDKCLPLQRREKNEAEVYARASE